jgi:hypothetical protein
LGGSNQVQLSATKRVFVPCGFDVRSVLCVSGGLLRPELPPHRIYVYPMCILFYILHLFLQSALQPWVGFFLLEDEENRGIALHCLDLGARRRWVVSTTPRPLYPRERPGTHCTGIGWASGPFWTRAKIFASTGIRSPDRPARS